MTLNLTRNILCSEILKICHSPLFYPFPFSLFFFFNGVFVCVCVCLVILRCFGFNFLLLLLSSVLRLFLSRCLHFNHVDNSFDVILWYYLRCVEILQHDNQERRYLIETNLRRGVTSKSISFKWNYCPTFLE